jgi:hypothetical protein
MADINDPKKVDDRTHPGFHARRGRLGWELGTERLGLSVWDVPPGEAVDYDEGETPPAAPSGDG